jgi:hypothetical protein
MTVILASGENDANRTQDCTETTVVLCARVQSGTRFAHVECCFAPNRQSINSPPSVLLSKIRSFAAPGSSAGAASAVDGSGKRLATFATGVCTGRRFLMVMEKSISPRRAPLSDVATSRSAPNEVERVRLAEWRPAGSAAKGIDLADGAPRQTLLDAVEDQRMDLLNVLGIVHSMSASFVDADENPAPEICAAFALLEQAIQRVAAGLEEGSLRNAM